MTIILDEQDIEPIVQLTADLKRAAATLSQTEVRYLVDYYYQQQEYRKRADNQILAMSEEPHTVVRWLADNTRRLEDAIRKALAAYSISRPVGVWAESITGIGPVISAGLLAHVNIELCPTVGHLWRFAGLDPTTLWDKGQKRPWNARLKTLCWKIGESFVKVSNNSKDFYGHLYAIRKEREISQNDLGVYGEQAAAKLQRFRIGKDTEAFKWYSQGKLPPGHIHARAKRWAVKLFLAHWHWVAYEIHYGTPPPKPYVIEHLGHTDILKPPNWPM